MPKVAGRDTYIKLYSGSTGASNNISGDGNSVTISWSAEAPETTGFTNRQRTRLTGGIRDVALDMNGYWNTSVNAVDQLFDEIKGGTGCPMLLIAMGGSSAGSPVYTACVVMTTYNVEAPYDGVVTWTAAFSLRSGSITRTLAG